MKTEAAAGSGPGRNSSRDSPEPSRALVRLPHLARPDPSRRGGRGGRPPPRPDRSPAPGGRLRGARAVQRPLRLAPALAGRRALRSAMAGRAPLGVAREALRAWLLGGLCFWALGGLCGLGAAAPGAGAGAGGVPGTPRPCQAPQQWEGRQVLYRQSSGRNSRALLSYDGLNQRVRVLDERKALIPCKRYAGRGVGVGAARRGRGGGGGASLLPRRKVAGRVAGGGPVGGWREGSAHRAPRYSAGRWPVEKDPGRGGIASQRPGAHVRPGAHAAESGPRLWASHLHHLVSSRSPLRGRHAECIYIKNSCCIF